MAGLVAHIEGPDGFGRHAFPVHLGEKAGELTDEAAGWTGLAPGTPVAVANVDAHVTLPVTGSVEPGTLVEMRATDRLRIGGRVIQVELHHSG